jgi:hypothetical protein
MGNFMDIASIEHDFKKLKRRNYYHVLSFQGNQSPTLILILSIRNNRNYTSLVHKCSNLRNQNRTSNERAYHMLKPRLAHYIKYLSIIFLLECLINFLKAATKLAKDPSIIIIRLNIIG